MVTIDLTATPPPSAAPGFLEGLPRRLTLTLPELRHAAHLAADAPLPFDVADQPSGSPAASAPQGLEGRLGSSRGTTDTAAYAGTLDSLHDGEDSLRRRGLLGDAGLDEGLAGSVGLLATPSLALEIDVSLGGAQVKAWHRHGGGAVATLGTLDGIVFELAWFPAEQWPAELARVATLPTDLELTSSEVPASLDLPYSLVDAVGEALRSGRGDLVPVLLQQHEGAITGVDGDASAAVTGVHTEGRGRLRVLAAQVADQATTEVGVVSWVLLADGWHTLTTYQSDGSEGAPHLSVRRVEPGDLAAELAPVIAEVTAGAPA